MAGIEPLPAGCAVGRGAGGAERASPRQSASWHASTWQPATGQPATWHPSTGRPATWQPSSLPPSSLPPATKPQASGTTAAAADAPVLATARPAQVLAFYGACLRLCELDRDEDEAGLTGVTFPLPCCSGALTFRTVAQRAVSPAERAWLLFMIVRACAYHALVHRLDRLGHAPVAAPHPRLAGLSHTVEDPDGRLVTLTLGWQP